MSKNRLAYIAPPKNNVWYFLTFGKLPWLILVHVLLGFSGLFTPFLLVAWVYFIFISFVVLSPKFQRHIIPVFLVYLIGIEVLARMFTAYPFIPWEIGKYLGLALLLYGLILNRNTKKGKVGLLIILLSLPGVLLAIDARSSWVLDVVFNYLGLFNLGLAILFFANLTYQPAQIARILRVFVLSAFSVLSYSFFNVPDIEEVQFQLLANFQMTAGFGSNQVATILGTAFGISFFLWLIRVKLFKIDAMNLVIPGIFLFWSILTFSRGGVISSVTAIILIVLFVKKGKSLYMPRRLSPQSIVALIVILPGMFYITNEFTGGILVKRYAGETYATDLGLKEKSLTTLTTNRWDISLSDIVIWQDNFTLGVGAGQSRYFRSEYNMRGILPHVEATRLLSEHGLLGFLIMILLFGLPFYLYLNTSSSFKRSFLIFVFTVSLASSMHSAMRTSITPVLYGLGFVGIIQPKAKRKPPFIEIYNPDEED